MIRLKQLFFLPLLAVVSVLSVTAQESDFDLSSQRSEKQEFNKVPGYKIDHKGLIINPTPHSITLQDNDKLDISTGFAIKDRRKAFGSDMSFLTQNPKGVLLDIDFGIKQAKKAGVKEVSGAYNLTVTPKKITLTGYDERGAFYALQTLRQIIESPMSASGELPLLIVNDYPDLKYRGVVEGFYGTPWSHQVRLSLLDYYGRNKMNNYLYGPKDDPYHSSPYWRQPYPEEQAKNIHELVERARKNRVDFIWAIHPGKDIRWNKADYDSLVRKFDMMYDLGVRSFAIFFDDIEGEGTNPYKQVELLNNLTADFVKAKGDVTNLIVCPTDYSRLWAKPGPDGPLAVYGDNLDKSVEVFYTGDVVCSDLTPETMEFLNSRIKRPGLYWWNYPVTDYCRNILLQGPVYGLDTTLSSKEVVGFESNPMEHGEASKLALYGVADYAWNISAYNPIDNWERGLNDLMPGAAAAYRTFAIHSTDTETGYRRDESWETEIFPFNKYTPEQYGKLKREFAKVRDAEAAIKAGCTNEALLSEIGPWLEEFTKLGKRGLSVLELIRKYESGVDGLFWNGYVTNLMSDEDKKAYEAHKIGTMKLQPFYENSMRDMLKAFYTRLTGIKPMIYSGVGSYPNLRTTQARLMFDNDTTTFYTSAVSQSAGDWIGVDLGDLRSVSEVEVCQGRNSVDDVDYFDAVQLEASVDGRGWTALTDSLSNTYIIKWTGDPVSARYLRLKRLASSRNNWAAVRSFKVNPVSAERVGLNIEAADPDGVLLGFDKDPLSVYKSVGDIVFDRVKDAKECILLLSDLKGNVRFVQLDAKGNEIASMDITEPFTSVSLEQSAVRLKLGGESSVYEIVQR